jgi:hypothetical protein
MDVFAGTSQALSYQPRVIANAAALGRVFRSDQVPDCAGRAPSTLSIKKLYFQFKAASAQCSCRSLTRPIDS